MDNNIIELAVNINCCPYCGSEYLTDVDSENINCDDCGRDFMVMTHE